MSVSGIYALTSQETNGTISTDIVDIEIHNFKKSGNNDETKYGNEVNIVVPGEEVSLIPKVYNLGMDCYLRIKIKYVDSDIDFADYVTGFSEDFTKYGDYYYYNKILNSREIVKIFDTIKIPEDAKGRATNGKIKLEIIAEAIQGRNFQPNYTLDDPWNNVKPAKTVNNTYEVDEDDSKVTINYADNTDKDISVSKDFFERAKRLVPGDSFIDSIKIKNNNKEKTKYYMSFKTEKTRNNETDLLKQIQLVITRKNGQVLYQGKLLNSNKILLGEYSSGEKDELYFDVLVPEELDNQYENLNPKLLVVFSSEYDNKKNTDNNPQTGDSIDVAITIFFMSAIGLVIVMLISYREKKKEC